LGYYRLDIVRANKIVSDVCMVVKGWKDQAGRLGLTAQECSEAEHLFLVQTVLPVYHCL
jgi:serine/threonine-protein kinase HipA